MFGKRFPRERGKKRRKQKKPTVETERVFSYDRVFGNIPLICHETVNPDGKVYKWWQYDPQYEPPLPRGAVRGDVSKQVFCTACHTPKYFFVDEERQCIQCGNAFIFTGSEQKYWYETLKFNFSSIPIRCVSCRRERRSEQALRQQIARAKAEIGSEDPAPYLALARAIIEYHEKTEHGDLNQAIADDQRLNSPSILSHDHPLSWTVLSTLETELRRTKMKRSHLLLAVGLTLGVVISVPGQQASKSAASELAKEERSLAMTIDTKEKFYLTTKLATIALAAGETAKATSYSYSLLGQAPAMLGNWNYGNAIHVAHLVLGEIALNEGNLPEAKRHLLEAANIPGSPQLDTFGPNMRLAQQLLAKGERDVVVQYFDLCAAFWDAQFSQLEGWKAIVLKGGEPRFGANLVYQFYGFR
jgi:hypothetical protein